MFTDIQDDILAGEGLPKNKRPKGAVSTLIPDEEAPTKPTKPKKTAKK